jgi:hypothetical protein
MWRRRMTATSSAGRATTTPDRHRAWSDMCDSAQDGARLGAQRFYRARRRPQMGRAQMFSRNTRNKPQRAQRTQRRRERRKGPDSGSGTLFPSGLCVLCVLCGERSGNPPGFKPIGALGASGPARVPANPSQPLLPQPWRPQPRLQGLRPVPPRRQVCLQALRPLLGRRGNRLQALRPLLARRGKRLQALRGLPGPRKSSRILAGDDLH